jgi:hypothetical protein
VNGDRLLERNGESATVAELLQDGGVVLVEGRASIGKTALLEAACQRAAGLGHQVLRAPGSEPPPRPLAGRSAFTTPDERHESRRCFSGFRLGRYPAARSRRGRSPAGKAPALRTGSVLDIARVPIDCPLTGSTITHRGGRRGPPANQH